MSTSGNNASVMMIPMEPVKPLPKIRDRKDHQTKCWTRDDLATAIQAQAIAKGETDGDASSIKVKAKPGRPLKTSSDGDDAHAHFYLENSDGTPISKTSLLALSQKARGIWEVLLSRGQAPKQWGKLSSIAWDYYARVMLNEPGLEFLQLCDDGQWKLREWSQRNYSRWAGTRGVRDKRKQKPKSENADINDEQLLTMNEHEDDLDDTEDVPLTQVGKCSGSSDRDREEISRLSTRPPTHTSSVVLDPFAPTSFGPYMPSTNTNTTAGTHATSETRRSHPAPTVPEPIDVTGAASGTATPNTLMATTSTNSEPRSTGPAHIPDSTVAATPPTLTDASSDGTTTRNHTDPMTMDTATTSGRPVSATPTSSAPPAALPRFRVMLKLTRPSNTTPDATSTSDGGIAAAPPTSEVEPVVGSRRTSKGSENTPAHAVPDNLRLERARENAERKRKPEAADPGCAPTKKQKTPPVNALAKPSEGNSVRNVCMRHWSEQQHDGQGLAADFDEYFKRLSEYDKEPFKKEMRAIQCATRKARTTAKKMADAS